AYMANAVLPLRAGEVVRVYVLARKLRESERMTGAQSVWLVTATLVVERVLDSLAIVSILAMLVLVIPLPRVIEWAAGVLLAIDGVGIRVPSAPGYVGVFHAAATAALEVFGVPRSAALAFALLYHASVIVPTTLVGWLFLLREHISLGEARRAPTPAA